MSAPIDWGKIRMEYALKKTSYRKLAEKYGVNFKTLARKAKAEGWVQMSTEVEDKVSTESMQQAVQEGVDYAKRLYSLGGKVMQKAEELLNLEDALAPRDLKSLSSTLVDLKNLYGVDEQEQEQGEHVEVVFVSRAEEATR